MPYDRGTLRRLAESRLAEAKTLAQAGCPSGAYYLAGYAIECALKSRIAERFREGEIPDRTLVNSVYTHDLPALLRLAGLESQLKDAAEADTGLARRWAVIEKWSEQARYAIWTAEDASAMIDAIEGRPGAEGLLSWLTSG
jgi:hypothetical protein